MAIPFALLCHSWHNSRGRRIVPNKPGLPSAELARLTIERWRPRLALPWLRHYAPATAPHAATHPEEPCPAQLGKVARRGTRPPAANHRAGHSRGQGGSRRRPRGTSSAQGTKPGCCRAVRVSSGPICACFLPWPRPKLRHIHRKFYVSLSLIFSPPPFLSFPPAFFLLSPLFSSLSEFAPCLLCLLQLPEVSPVRLSVCSCRTFKGALKVL